jgi:tRNA threonylcarbamoyladenosine biosynthesis protein TsaE
MKNTVTITTNSAQETQKAAQALAVLVKKAKRTHALVIGLRGNLGSGKTTFAQGFAKGLGITERVLSPTFFIVKQYKLQDTRYKLQTLYHVDCYRLQKPKELLDLGWKEIMQNPKSIVLVEWPDKVKTSIPKDTIWIFFHHKNKKENQRRIFFSA